MADCRIPVQARSLHMAMYIALDKEIASGTVDYNRFEAMSLTYLGAGDIATCASVIDLLRKLQKAGYISVGKYDVLKEILSHASLAELRELVEKRELEITEMLAMADVSEEPVDSPAYCSSSDEAQTTPVIAVPGINVHNVNSSVTEMNIASKIVIENQHCYPSSPVPRQGTDQEVYPTRYMDLVASDTIVRKKSKLFRSYCQMKIRGSFVKTKFCTEAEAIMCSGENGDCFLITGGSGDGKTSILYYLAASTLCLPLRCTTPEDVENCIRQHTTDEPLMFVFDDLFGGSYTQHNIVTEWINKIKGLEIYLASHKFVFATRTSVWEDCELHFRDSPFFQKRVMVTSANLTDADKRAMLETYLGSSESLTSRQVAAVVNMDKHIAYAQCCKHMADAIERGQSGDLLVQIFKSPFFFLRSQLEIMAKKERVEYFVLCLIMLCGGSLKCQDLNGTISTLTPYLRKRITAVQLGCNCPRITCPDLRDGADKLTGTFLEKVQTADDASSCEIYKFSHDSILETVTMEYGQRNFHHCLQFLTSDVVEKVVRPSSYSKHGESSEKEFAIEVSEEFYPKIAEIFTNSVAGYHGGMPSVFKNPCVQDKRFQLHWCGHLKSLWWFQRRRFCHARDSYGRPCFVNRFMLWNWIAYPNIPEENGERCVLYYAARYGTDVLLKYLMVDLRLTCKCTCSHADRPLGGAVAGGHVCILSQLMKLESFGWYDLSQAVETACEFGSDAVLGILLSEMRDVDKEKAVEKGLTLACSRGRLETVRYLLDVSYTPCTEQKCACGKGLLKASKKGRLNVIQLLLAHGADINWRNVGGRTCLHSAARGGDVDTLRYLISRGADVNAKNEYNVSPLHQAAFSSRTEAVSILLESGADVNARDRLKRTPLSLAANMYYGRRASVSDVDIMRLLLAKGADFDIRDKWNRAPPEWAELYGTEEVANVFREHGHRSSVSEENLDWFKPNYDDEEDVQYQCGYS